MKIIRIIIVLLIICVPASFILTDRFCEAPCRSSVCYISDGACFLPESFSGMNGYLEKINNLIH